MQGGEGKDEKLPPGFRFHPTDEELITYYLINKISDASFTGRAVADVDLNKCEPWDLPGISSCCFNFISMHIFVNIDRFSNFVFPIVAQNFAPSSGADS